MFLDNRFTLFGEGYGVKIQKGEKYIKDGVDFILFDVLSFIMFIWYTYTDVEGNTNLCNHYLLL